MNRYEQFIEKMAGYIGSGTNNAGATHNFSPYIGYGTGTANNNISANASGDLPSWLEMINTSTKPQTTSRQPYKNTQNRARGFAEKVHEVPPFPGMFSSASPNGYEYDH